MKDQAVSVIPMRIKMEAEILEERTIPMLPTIYKISPVNNVGLSQGFNVAGEKNPTRMGKFIE